MTSTLDASPATTPADVAAQRAQEWFGAFEDALRARDVDRAAGLFARTSFWRDLVAFTWNIKTLEGPEEIREMLEALVAGTRIAAGRAVAA